MAGDEYDIAIFANTTVGRALQNQCDNVPSVMLGALWYEGGTALYGVYATVLLVVHDAIHTRGGDLITPPWVRTAEVLRMGRVMVGRSARPNGGWMPFMRRATSTGRADGSAELDPGRGTS